MSSNDARQTREEVNTPAIWHCFTPFLASHSARTSVMPCGGNATGKVNSVLYRDMVVMCYNKRQCFGVYNVHHALTKPVGIWALTGLESTPKMLTISRIRSDR